MADQVTLDERHQERVQRAITAFWSKHGEVTVPNEVLIATLDSYRPELVLERFVRDLMAASRRASDAPSSVSGDAARHPDPRFRGRLRSSAI